MNLLIVESPTKAKTISRFLDKSYTIKSSYGHVRDLPRRQMGVDIEKNFEPKYVIPDKNKAVVAELIKLSKKADTVYYATDEDREGEAIAWHLSKALKAKKEKRITFHEITESAIKDALEHSRDIDINLVNAQQARRVLDRLVGYELSPFLWRKITKGLSAGRVQSVALRLIVEREREIQDFKSEEYWTIEGEFTKTKTSNPISAKLYKIDDDVLEKFSITKDKDAKKITNDLEKSKFKIDSIEKKESKRTPPPPFITSTLQQEANKKLGFSSKQTMLIAQQLYEGIELGKEGQVGLITYMRTDSVNLSGQFLNDAVKTITKEFGEKYSQVRKFKTKSKGAQEAHEAVRPAEARRAPESLKNILNNQQLKLYELIWKRAMASQMSDAKISNTTINIVNNQKNATTLYTLRANGMIINFAGFLKIYPDLQKESVLPRVNEKDKLDLEKIEPLQHFTEPPARFSDASLVKILEEHGIGRPSTYAPTISTLIDRKYVERLQNRRLGPTEIAFVVNDLLVKHFPRIVDFEFTAKMEEDLDEIASKGKDWAKIIKNFYEPFKKNLMKKDKEIDKKEITEEKTERVCDKCNSPMVIKMGRYGKFYACTAFPKCKNAQPIKKEMTEEDVAENKELTAKEKCENCGGEMEVKEGRFGKYLACKKYPECKYTKSIVKSLEIKCPECGKGEIVERRSKRGRKFYGCDKFPKCKYALWYRPVKREDSDEIAKCDKCNSALVYKGKDNIKCSNKDCEEA
ncbi:MAG: type I DNA topoisomerase [Patescibacteria group bacterium]|nr:type I DNA topoisomerase [Patescibacteria group bacterium]